MTRITRSTSRRDDKGGIVIETTENIRGGTRTQTTYVSRKEIIAAGYVDKDEVVAAIEEQTGKATGTMHHVGIWTMALSEAVQAVKALGKSS